MHCETSRRDRSEELRRRKCKMTIAQESGGEHKMEAMEEQPARK